MARCDAEAGVGLGPQVASHDGVPKSLVVLVSAVVERSGGNGGGGEGGRSVAIVVAIPTSPTIANRACVKLIGPQPHRNGLTRWPLTSCARHRRLEEDGAFALRLLARPKDKARRQQNAVVRGVPILRGVEVVGEGDEDARALVGDPRHRMHIRPRLLNYIITETCLRL